MKNTSKLFYFGLGIMLSMTTLIVGEGIIKSIEISGKTRYLIMSLNIIGATLVVIGRTLNKRNDQAQ